MQVKRNKNQGQVMLWELSDTKGEFDVKKIFGIILEGLPIQRNYDCNCMW